MSVPMSLDYVSLDDYHDTEMIPVNKKVRSLDVDDDDNLEKVKRKIRKIASMDDVLRARVTFTNKNELQNDISHTLSRNDISDDDDLTHTHNEISNGDLTLPRNEISDGDLTLPKLGLRMLASNLPAMADTFGNKDWSLLRKFCFRIESENLSFKEAIDVELVATCIWFLLAKTYPLHVKVGVASALQFILSSARKATDMPIVQEKFVDDAPTKMSIDQAYFDGLVVEALRSGDKEIVRQVCWTIVYLGFARQTDTLGTSIQNQLLKLACSFTFSYDTHVATCVLSVINSVNRYFEGSLMKKSLVESVHSDRQWLLNIMKDPDEDLEQLSYDLLEWITRGKYDEKLFEALLYDIIPLILKRGSAINIGVCLQRCAARVISNAINGAASTDHIEALVIDSGCIHVLLRFLYQINDASTINMCMEALENILKSGAKDDPSEYSIYAIEIGEFRELGGGWSLLDNAAPNSKDILVKYAPLKCLLKCAPLKRLRHKPRFAAILRDRGFGNDFLFR